MEKTETAEEVNFDILIKFFDAWDYAHGSKGKEVQNFLRLSEERVRELEGEVKELTSENNDLTCKLEDSDAVGEEEVKNLNARIKELEGANEFEREEVGRFRDAHLRAIQRIKELKEELELEKLKKN